MTRILKGYQLRLGLLVSLALALVAFGLWPSLGHAAVQQQQGAATSSGNVNHYTFEVVIDGVTVNGIEGVSGLDSSTEVVEYQDGNGVVRKKPGRTTYSNITLKRGLVPADQMWAWRKDVIDGKVDRKSGSIIVMDSSGKEVARYNFFEAWPCSWSGPTLGSDGQLYETIGLAVGSWGKQ